MLLKTVLHVVIQYFDSDQQDVTDALLDIVSVKDGCSLSLYNAKKDVFQEKNIPLNNVIGLGCDNCSYKMEKLGGPQKLLRADVPSIFVMGCMCHSFALCSSKAVSILPPFLESFLKDLTSFFSQSAKTKRFCIDTRCCECSKSQNL